MSRVLSTARRIILKRVELQRSTICAHKMVNHLWMLYATIQRKRPKKNIEKFDKINEILSEFDNLQPDLQISSLCSTLERLGSLWNKF